VLVPALKPYVSTPACQIAGFNYSGNILGSDGSTPIADVEILCANDLQHTHSSRKIAAEVVKWIRRQIACCRSAAMNEP
jgi:hypothetical protein